MIAAGAEKFESKSFGGEKGYYKGDPRSDLTLEKVQSIFENQLFANCLLVDLQGGEPLLAKDFNRIVAFLADRGHLINTATNGLLLARRIADIKDAGISRISISVYESNWSMLERDLDKINSIFPVHMSLVLMRSMVDGQQDEMIEKARWFRDSGCLSLRLWGYRPPVANYKLEEIIDDTNKSYQDFRLRMEDALPGFCIWPETLQTGRAIVRVIWLSVVGPVQSCRDQTAICLMRIPISSSITLRLFRCAKT